MQQSALITEIGTKVCYFRKMLSFIPHRKGKYSKTAVLDLSEVNSLVT